jgi:hypothetical protein
MAERFKASRHIVSLLGRRGGFNKEWRLKYIISSRKRMYSSLFERGLLIKQGAIWRSLIFKHSQEFVDPKYKAVVFTEKK